jgi:hypothetical protein
MKRWMKPGLGLQKEPGLGPQMKLEIELRHTL